MNSGWVSEDLVSALSVLGLSRKEAMVLAYLLIKGEATAREIIADLSIHQPQLYNILSSLARKGFVNVQDSKPKVYIPINPGLIMEMIESELSKRRQALINALSGQPKGAAQRSLIWVTRGIDNVLNNVASLIKEAESELYISSSSVMLRRMIKYLKGLRRGVKAYILVYLDIDDELLNELKGIENVVEVKVNRLGPYYLLSPDSKSCIFMLRKVSMLESSDAYAYVFRDRDMAVHFIQSLFNVWRRSTTVYRRPFRQDEYPLIFNNQRFAVWEILRALESGQNIKVKVRGRFIKTGEEVEFVGKPIDVSISDEVVNFKAIPEGSMKPLLIGGTNAVVEDVESEYIEIMQA